MPDFSWIQPKLIAFFMMENSRKPYQIEIEELDYNGELALVRFSNGQKAWHSFENLFRTYHEAITYYGD